MTVSDIARELAEAVIAARPASTPRQRLLLEQFRLLPLYKAIGNVSIWDAAYHAVMSDEDDTSDIGRLIEAIYEFATDSFYGAFQTHETFRVYEATCSSLRAAGITCPTVAQFTDL
jgi:hypothetical protein